MSIDSTLNNEPVLEASVQFPLSGSWSAELQVAAEDAPAAGEVVTFSLADRDFVARVTRSGVESQRASLRLTGGSIDWSAEQEVKHYRNTDTDQVLADVGVTTEAPTAKALSFWTRNPGTTGSTVEAVAKHLGLNWRVLPDGAVRMSEETSTAVELDSATTVEMHRDPSRGIVTLAVESALILPGVTVGEDSVGDVMYEIGTTFRCRYYTEGRGRIRQGLERIIRWVMRDTLFLGQYTAEVVTQNADGTLDVLPDDLKIRAQGLQSVPIRHGLPGVEVDVPAGVRVLVGFDGGNPAAPYAALWHEGSVTAVRIGGSDAVAMASLVEARLTELKDAIGLGIPVPNDGGAAVQTAAVGALSTFPASVASGKLFTE